MKPINDNLFTWFEKFHAFSSDLLVLKTHGVVPANNFEIKTHNEVIKFVFERTHSENSEEWVYMTYKEILGKRKAYIFNN